jgi:hypothetical protein
MSKLVVNDFYIVMFYKRIYFISIHDKQLLFLNRRLEMAFTINIDKLKTIIIKNRYTILLKFYKGWGINDLILRFLSIQDKSKFLNDILPDSPKDKDIIFFRLVLLHMIRDRKIALSSVINRAIYKLSSTSFFYSSGLYSLLKAPKLSFPKLFFIFNNICVLEKLLGCLVFNQSYIRLKVNHDEIIDGYRNHRDSMRIIRKKRKETLKAIGVKVNGRLEPIPGISRVKTSDDGFRGRNRGVQYIPHSKTTYHKKSYISNNKLFDKPKFNRVIFNVMQVRYFGKDEKILEINNNGIFSIYNKKNKVNKLLNYRQITF